MVRKRTRRYDSDDNDSDSDLELNLDQSARSEPKRYSLRERKRTLFTTDFDYYGLDDDDAEARRQSSDDEDFEVEAGTEIIEENGGATTYYEPDPEAIPANAEGLIDFEDIIRADIVVNKNKIDYDNLIQKTEIKLHQPSTQSSPKMEPQQKKRRGRPPKNRSNDDVKVELETKIECQPDLQTSSHVEENNGGEKIEVKESIGEEQAAQECLPNGEVENPADVKNDEKQESLVDEVSKETQQDLPEESEGVKEPEEDDDDDVILLEETKPVIVLDD